MTKEQGISDNTAAAESSEVVGNFLPQTNLTNRKYIAQEIFPQVARLHSDVSALLSSATQPASLTLCKAAQAC